MVPIRQINMTQALQTSFADIEISFPLLIAGVPGMRTSNSPLFVRRLIYGSGHRDLCVDNPTWEQIAVTIDDLNNRNDVLLEGQATSPYLVVGGQVGKYVVIVGQENGTYYLSDPSLREQEPSLIVLGGQASGYEADLFVGTEMAMTAIWAFVEHGVLSPSLR